MSNINAMPGIFPDNVSSYFHHGKTLEAPSVCSIQVRSGKIILAIYTATLLLAQVGSYLTTKTQGSLIFP
jgi:hypothetical protein